MDDFKIFTKDNVSKIINFEDINPFHILGPHYNKYTRELYINCYFPNSVEVRVKPYDKSKSEVKMKKINKAGFYQVLYENEDGEFNYKLIVKYPEGYPLEKEDPYAFSRSITDFDLYLMGEGNHFRTYEKYGAKVRIKDGVKGVEFTVWAPNAKAVCVVGDFNYWTTGSYPLENVNGSGVWALFIPELDEGEVYKFALKSWDNHIFMKSDPYAFYTELRPKTGSVVRNIDNYKWNDSNWLEKRQNWNFLSQPISIYEVHLGSWKKDYNNIGFPNEWGFKSYVQLAYELVDYVKKTGYTHIELLPVMEHPLDQSWGYQVLNYYAPTSRYGTPEDFMFFVDYCHQNDIGVILDWVPAHFPSDPHGIAYFDDTQIYAYQSWKKGYHMEWGTFVFDYGRNEVINFLISNALFWFDKYHVDGLRVDAVASMLYLDYSRKDGEWEPNIYGGRENLEAIEFLKKLNVIVHEYYKGVLMIAEESTAFGGVTLPVYLGGLGFDMKWNMGWMHDFLEYFSLDPIYRKYHHNKITFSLWYAFSENFILPVSHDEVVYGKKSLFEKMPGDKFQKFANLRMFFTLMFGHPGKKLNFMGNDIGQYNEWNSESSVDWFVLDYETHGKLNHCVRDLNIIYKNYRALHEQDFRSEGFEWIDFSDADNSVIAFMRRSADWKQILIFTFNLTPVVRDNYLFGVPHPGFYSEIFNSDALEYGGSGLGNSGGVNSEPTRRFLRDHSIRAKLPPLAANIFLFEQY